MRFDQNPSYRAIIVPWYDSEKVCLLIVFLMLIVFFFSVTGILVASEYVEYNRYVWMPVLLCIISGIVIVSTVLRVIRRYIARYSS